MNNLIILRRQKKVNKVHLMRYELSAVQLSNIPIHAALQLDDLITIGLSVVSTEIAVITHRAIATVA